MALNILIMGPAGAGKGTMSEKIEKHYHIVHISSGDLFRQEIQDQTELGQQASQYIAQGLLVPDDVTIEMVFKRLQQPDCEAGYLLDGFPRSLVQADIFDTKVMGTSREIGMVVDLTVEEKALEERIVNRRVCPNCGAVYNTVTLKPKQEGVCDVCGSQLVQRPDDNPESLRKRMETYHQQTAPVLDHYRALNLVHEIDASQPIEKVWFDLESEIDALLDARRKEGR